MPPLQNLEFAMSALVPESAIKRKTAHQKLEKANGKVASLLTQISHACNSFLHPERLFRIKMQTSSLFCGHHFAIILDCDSCCNTLPSELEQAVLLMGFMTTSDSLQEVRFSGAISVTWHYPAWWDASHQDCDPNHHTETKQVAGTHTLPTSTQAAEQNNLHGRYYSGIRLGINLAWRQLAKNKVTFLVTKTRPSSTGPEGILQRIQASAWTQELDSSMLC